MSYSPLKTIGLMSGTSLDGVDAAILGTDGEEIIAFGATHFRPYTTQERAILQKATQAAITWGFNGPQPNIFAQAEVIIHTAHIEAVQAILKKSGADISLIGFHGQTVFHRPPTQDKIGKTLQLGNGQVLADALGIDVVCDFRTADVKAGGQGAPLAPLYHQALLAHSKISGTAAIVNIGGVSNLTMLGRGEVLRASDCGPGNGPLDVWIEKCGLGNFDKNGRVALAGTPDIARIEKWLQLDFFAKPVPKSADRWDFDVLADIEGMSAQDGAATLVVFTAMAIKHTLNQYDQDIDMLIICGGGRKNPAIMAGLKEQGVKTVVNADDLQWRGDMLEAEAFAYLAVRSKHGLPLSLPETTGVKTPMSGGIYCKAKLFEQ